jgi:hypothetical protein
VLTERFVHPQVGHFNAATAQLLQQVQTLTAAQENVRKVRDKAQELLAHLDASRKVCLFALVSLVTANRYI